MLVQNHHHNHQHINNSKNQHDHHMSLSNLIVNKQTKETFNKNIDQDSDQLKREIKNEYFALPPKALLSPTTTRDIYETSRLKTSIDAASASLPTISTSSASSSVSVPQNVATTATTVTAHRRRDLKLRAEQQNNDQIELNKASLHHGDEVAL